MVIFTFCKVSLEITVGDGDSTSREKQTILSCKFNARRDILIVGEDIILPPKTNDLKSRIWFAKQTIHGRGGPRVLPLLSFKFYVYKRRETSPRPTPIKYATKDSLCYFLWLCKRKESNQRNAVGYFAACGRRLGTLSQDPARFLKNLDKTS